MTRMVTSSEGARHREKRQRLSRALAKTRITKGTPTPMGKKDQVISEEPTIQIEYGAPRLINKTSPRPSRREGRVRPGAEDSGARVGGMGIGPHLQHRRRGPLADHQQFVGGQVAQGLGAAVWPGEFK
jgi:hypothetical protein